MRFQSKIEMLGYMSPSLWTWHLLNTWIFLWDDDINKHIFKMYYKMCQHMHDSVNQYFPMTNIFQWSGCLKNQAWVKDPFKLKSRPAVFSITEKKLYWYDCRFHIMTNIQEKKKNTSNFSVVSKELYICSHMERLLK